MKFLIQPLSFLGFFLHTAREHPYEFYMRQEFCGEYPYHRIRRYGNEHSDHSSHIAGHKKDDEDFERVGLYAVGIYYRLEYVIVNELREDENGYKYGRISPEADIYPHRVCRIVFQYQAEESADYASCEWTYVWNDVEQSGHEGYADSHAESQAGNEMQSYRVDERHSDDFDDEPYEIAAEQSVHVFYRLSRFLRVFVVYERQYDVFEHIVIVYEEKRDEHDGEKPYAYVDDCPCRRAYD